MKMCLVIMLVLCGSTCGEGQAALHGAPMGTLDFGYVPAGNYETNTYYDPGAIGILFQMVHAFLSVVQPNPFPHDLVIEVTQQKIVGLQRNYKKVIHYELGFIICTVLGILFFLLVPVVGLCFCLCRCCDNCGGEMHQRHKKNADCQRGCHATLLFITSLTISVGLLFAYVANQNLSTQAKGITKLVNSNFKDLRTLVESAPGQIEYMANQYNTSKERAISDLDNISSKLGSRIQEHLGKDVHPALDAALSMAGAIRETKEALENVNISVEVLQEGTSKLQGNLTDVRRNLSNTLSDPACTAPTAREACDSIRRKLDQLSTDANFTGLPDVSQELAKVNDVLKTDLTTLVQKGYTAFNDTPEIVKNQTKNIVSDIKNALNSVGSNITERTKMFPIQEGVSNITRIITQKQASVQNYFPLIEQYDFYRWLFCIALCCMVLIILAFNYLGLLCGYCGYDKNASPTTRGCISNTGGNLLMAGVGFSFIFSWVLMIIVVLTFFIGGNIEKLGCEPLSDGSIFKMLDTPFILNSQWRNYLPGILYQNPEVNLTFEKVYRKCKANTGIYTALQLDNLYNISSFLNISMYTKNLTSKFDDIDVDLGSIVLLDHAGKQNLQNFTDSGIGSINYAAFEKEVNKGVTKVDLLAFANDIEAKADTLPKGALENALKGHASSIRSIHSKQVVPLEQTMSTLNKSIQILKTTSLGLSLKVQNVITAVETAQNLITKNASRVVIQETKKYMEVIIGYFEQYLNWVKDSISKEVAGCKPVANVVDTVDIIACSYIMDSMNAFWFGLGCCTIFLIPSIILGVKLAKYYRRMDTEDVYDDAVNEQWQ